MYWTSDKSSILKLDLNTGEGEEGIRKVEPKLQERMESRWILWQKLDIKAACWRALNLWQKSM